MPQMPTLEFQEGETRTFTWTAKMAGVVQDLTGKTVTIDARDRDAPAGTKRIAAGACSVPVPANGEILYTFSAANLLITESTEHATHVDGSYRLKIVGGGETWKTKRGSFVIDRDPMDAAT